MPVVKLTQTFVDKLRAPHPSGKQVIYLDTVTKGLRCSSLGYDDGNRLHCAARAAAEGSRCEEANATNSKLLRIEVARERAEDALDQIRRGIDPKANAGAEPEAPGGPIQDLKARAGVAVLFYETQHLPPCRVPDGEEE